MCTLVTPTLTGLGVQTFNAPSSDPCPNLQANSTYHVVVTQTTFTESFKVHSTTGDNEDSGAATGWTIANNSNSYVDSTSSWGADSSSRALMIEVKGTAVVTPALVKNTGQTSSGTGTLSSGKRAQAFTTGRSGYGYAISSLGIDFSNIASTSTAGSNIKVTLNSVSGSDPGSVLCTLSDPTSFSSSGVQTFNVPPDTDSNPCPTLTPATTYFVVIERTGTGSDAIVLDLAGTSEDSGGAPGWSIADEQFFRTGLAWNRSTSQAHQIEVKGEIITGPGDVPLNWALTPTGLTTGDKFRLMFITHTGRRPTSTDIADYNTYVQSQANAGSAHTAIKRYSSWFRVVGSTADTDARDNTATRYTSAEKGVPIYWLNGNKVVDEYEDFYDRGWDDEANAKNRAGNASNPSGGLVWTGSNSNGTKKNPNSSHNYTLGRSNVNLGELNSSTGDPLDASESNSAWSFLANTLTNIPYYALSGVFVVPSDPPTISGTPRVNEILTADTTDITDPDGLTSPDYTYQWVRIDGMTQTDVGTDSSAYILTDNDAGKRIKVKVSFTDDLGNPEGPLESLPTDVVAAADVLVKNTGQASGSTARILDNTTTKRAQAFTTGANAAGYTLNSVGFVFDTIANTTTAGSHLNVTLNADSSGSPGSVLCTLADPNSFSASGLHTFSAPTTGTDLCPALTASTTYFAVIERVTHVVADTISLAETTSTDEDNGSVADWSIGNNRHYILSGLWSATTSGSVAHQIEVKGTAVETPSLVKNTGQTAESAGLALDGTNTQWAQAFTTGNSSTGYTVSTVGVRFHTIANTGTAADQLVARLTASVDSEPATMLCRLADPGTFSSSGVHTFSAPTTCPKLRANTTYHVVIRRVTNTSDVISFGKTSANGEDSGSAANWSIGDIAQYYDTSTWTDEAGNDALMIEVKGAVAPAVTPVTPTPTFDYTRYSDFSISAVSDAWGLATNGETFWISQDNSPIKNYAYHYKDDPDTNTVEQYGTRDSAKDITPPSEELNNLFMDDDYMWSCEFSIDNTQFFSSGAGVVAWNRTDLTRATDKDFKYRDTGDSFGGENSITLCYATVTYGDHIYLSDAVTSILRAYRISSTNYGTRDPDYDIWTPGDGIRGLYREGNILWVSSLSDKKIYAIDIRDSYRLEHLEFDLRPETDRPHGIWSNGVTMFVVDATHNNEQVHTYYRFRDNASGTITVDGSHQEGETLTCSASDISDPDGLPSPLSLSYRWQRPLESGQWVDIASANRDTYIVTASDASRSLRCTVSFIDGSGYQDVVRGAAITPPKRVTGFSLHSSNSSARGIWGNDDTFWVVNDGTGAANKLYAYNRSDGSRDTTADFDTLSAAGNESLRGVCSDGTTMFVTDHDDDKIFAYKMSDTTRDSTKDVTLATANGNPQGLSCDSSHLWVAEDNNDLTSKTFVYQRSDGSHASTLDIGASIMNPSTNVGAINNNDQRGMWSSGTTLFVVDDGDDKIYGYKLSDRTRDDDKNLILDTDNTNPEGLWFDGRVLWVVDSTDNKIYVYDLPGAQPDNTVAVGTPTISGTLFQGDTLTANVSGITDSTDGLANAHFLYQWIRVDGTTDTELDGATASTYTTTPGDVSKNIKVRVVFDDDAGYKEYPRTSSEVGPVLAPPAIDIAVTSDLIPSGITGDRFRLIFLTYTGQGVTSTDIATYNSYVQSQANAGNAYNSIKEYSSHFRVLASTEAVDARDNTSTTYTADDKGVPIYWLNGNKVADDYEDLYDGTWEDEANPTRRDGNTVSPGQVWTGSNNDGTENRDVSPDRTKGLGGNPFVRIGHLNNNTPNNGPLFASISLSQGLNTLPFYALSPVFVVPPSVSAISLSSDPNDDSRTGDDDTYAIGDAVEATVSFNVAADITGSPQLTLLFGTAEKTASCDAATNTTTMVCSYTVVLNDTAPLGVGVKANSLTLNSGTIMVTGTTTSVVLAQAAVGLQSGHKVDAIRPMLVTTGTDAPKTSADGSKIILTFIENISSLDHTKTTVKVGGTTVTTTGGRVNEKKAELDLTDPLLASSSALTVELAADAVEDSFGNGNIAIAATSVTNNVAAVPAAPAGLQAGPAPELKPQVVIILSWLASTYDGGSAVTKHQYRYKTGSNAFGSWTDIPLSAAGEDNNTLYAVRSLTAPNPPTTYTFEVQAVNDNGESGPSNHDTATVDVPSISTVTLTAGNQQITVEWTTAENHGSAILRYQIQQAQTVAGSATYTLWANIPDSGLGEANANSYTVTGLSNGAEYSFGIRAVNSVGTGLENFSDSAIPGTIPTAPRNLSAEPGDTKITLEWTAPASDGGNTIDGYEYQQKAGTNAYGSWTNISGADVNTTEHTVTGLTNGTSYTFKVRAKNPMGEGPASNEATATPVTVPTAPQSFTATAGNGSVRLDWTAPSSDGGSAIVRYEYRYKAGTGSFTSWATVPGSNINTTRYNVTGLTNGTAHTFEVRAATATHKGVAASGTATPMAVAPDKPSVTVQGRPESLYVSWSVSNDGGSDITEYQVQWKSGSDNFGTTNQQTGLTSTNTLIENLTNFTTYHVRVRAMNTIDWSDWSTTRSGTPTPRPPPSVSITASVSEPVTAPFRVTITFTDTDLNGNEHDVVGFEADEILPWYTREGHDRYEFQVTDFRVETTGRVYSALVDQIIDGRLWIEVEEDSAQSSLDGQGNTRSYRTWQVDAPDRAPAPEGAAIWTDTLTVGGEGTGHLGYFIGWSPSTKKDERFGALPGKNFHYGGASYEVLELSYTPDWRTVRLRICPGLQVPSRTFELRLGDKWVTFGSSKYSTRNFSRTKDGSDQQCLQYDWNPVTLDWEYGDAIPVRITRTETVPVTIEAGPAVAEGQPATFTLTRDGDNTDALIVNVSVTEENGSYISGTAPTSVIIAANSDTATLSVPTDDDNVVEHDGTIQAMIVSGNDYAPSFPSSDTVTVSDNDTAQWQLGPPTVTLYEGGAVDFITVFANGVTFAENQVLKLFIDGTTASDSSVTDILHIQSAYSEVDQATILAGGNANIIALSAIDNAIRSQTADRKTYSLTATLDGTQVGNAADVIIVDDEGIPQVTLASSDAEVAEGASITLTATLAPPYAEAVTVTLIHTDTSSVLSGTVPTSFDFAASTLTTSEATATATISTDNDTAQEADATVVFSLSSPTSPVTLGSPSSVTITVQDNDGPPTKPANISATAGDGKVDLSWGAASSDSSAIEKYQYRVRASSSSTWDPDWTDVTGGNAARSQEVTGLTNGTTYTFEVRARNATGNGEEATITSRPFGKPGKPSVTVVGRHESLYVSWSVPNDGGNPTTEYEVQWKSDTQSFDSSRQHAGLASTNTLIENLTNSTDYQVRVRAMNQGGWSDWSDTVTGAPTPRPPTTVSVTASVSEPVTAPFRVTFTFTDQDLEGNDTNGVVGFEADEINAYYVTEDDSGYEFFLTDFRVETPGRVYSALVDQIVDGRLWIEVKENAAQSSLDGQGNTRGFGTWQTDAPDPEPPPEGTAIWTDTLTVGGEDTGIMGYFIGWSRSSGQDERFGSLPGKNFNYGGASYEVLELSYTPDWRTVRLRICPWLQVPPRTFELRLGDKWVTFDRSKYSARNFSRTKDGSVQQCRQYDWDQVTLDWEYGQSISVRITR